MKKTSLIAIAGGLVGFSAMAMSDSSNMNNNNMNNNTMTVVSVQDVQGMSDNSPVVMRGYMLRQNGENSYVFQDSTGSINLEIDEEDWNGQTFMPSDFVEVWGEVDRNGASMIEVDVSAIKKL